MYPILETVNIFHAWFYIGVIWCTIGLQNPTGYLSTEQWKALKCKTLGAYPASSLAYYQCTCTDIDDASYYLSLLASTRASGISRHHWMFLTIVGYPLACAKRRKLASRNIAYWLLRSYNSWTIDIISMLERSRFRQIPTFVARWVVFRTNRRRWNVTRHTPRHPVPNYCNPRRACALRVIQDTILCHWPFSYYLWIWKSEYRGKMSMHKIQLKVLPLWPLGIGWPADWLIADSTDPTHLSLPGPQSPTSRRGWGSSLYMCTCNHSSYQGLIQDFVREGARPFSRCMRMRKGAEGVRYAVPF